MTPEEKSAVTDEDEAAYAPESGQPLGGRDNPWDDDDEKPGEARHAYPAEHHAPPKDEL